MFEFHSNGTFCVQAAWLFENNVLTPSNFKLMCHRNKIQKLTTGGNGRKALVAYDSLRSDIKEKIVSIVGTDPARTAHHIPFMDYLKLDEFARRFYQDHTLDNGEALPEKNQRQYTIEASIFNACTAILETTASKRKALGSKVKPWPRLAEVIQQLPQHTWPHSLPANHRRLQDKYNNYIRDGYACLIHKSFGSRNAEKLCEESKPWVLARWADQVKRCANYAQLLREYNREADQREWKQLKSEQTLKNFLQDTKIEPLWYGHRFGELKSKEKFAYQHSTALPSMRDSLWYADGTKLNYYYQDEKGKIATCQVYEVMDTFSEVFLGYYISETEDHEAQFHAFKMALQIAGHRPHEIKFDNQGGHRKLQSASFLGKISRICGNTQPYNGKSKTIESAFGRFQMEYLKQDWFFTGQNINAKRDESRQNMEFILENKDKLPTLDQVKEIYAQRRREWNQAQHSKSGEARLERYLSSENPATPEISLLDMVDMFWIQRERPVTCTAYGISFTEKKQEYHYSVYNDQRLPDIDWLRRNIDKKFIVKYDPDDFSQIWLYEDTPLGLRRVCMAETKTVVHRGRQEQEAFEASYIKQVEIENKRLRIADRDQMEAILEEQGRRAEDYGLSLPPIKGVESSRKQRKKTEKTDIGKYQKELSETVLLSDKMSIYHDL